MRRTNRVGAIGLLLVIFSLSLPYPARALTMTIYHSGYRLTVDNPVRQSVEHFYATQPESFTLTNTDGDTAGEITSDLTELGLDFSFEGQRGLGLDSAVLFEGGMIFSVDAPATYSASGSIQALDPDGDSIQFMARLSDQGHPSLGDSFFHHHVSNGIPNESFTLGQPGGNEINTAQGALIGTLVPGHHYQLLNYWTLGTDPEIPTLTSVATLSGSFSFSVSPSTVPEPGSITLLALGLVGLAVTGRRP